MLLSLIFSFGLIGCVGQVCFRLVGFRNQVLLSRFLVFRSSEELVARARCRIGSSLELEFGRSSERRRPVWTCSFAFLARASFSSLERVSSFFARAIVSSLERVSGYRPEGLSSSLDRVFFRSSELLGCWLEQGFLGSSVSFLCLVARATKSSLERACQG